MPLYEHTITFTCCGHQLRTSSRDAGVGAHRQFCRNSACENEEEYPDVDIKTKRIGS